jgi:hypothetical protein
MTILFIFQLILPARMLLGFASGGITSAAPVLLAEISTAEYRSQNVTCESNITNL